MSYDLGDVVPLSVNIRDTTGALANAGAVTLTVTQPDMTVAGPFTLTPTTTGVYDYDYPTTQVGRHEVRYVATGLNAAAYTDIFTVSPALSGAIISLADAKAQLNIPATNTTDDEELRRYIQAATEIINRKCGYSAPTPFTETVAGRVDASGRGMLILTRTPVLSVTSITAQLVGLPTTDISGLIVDGQAGQVYLANWYAFYGPLTVVYTAGRAFVPDALQLACAMIVGSLWRTQRGGGVAVPGIAGNDTTVVDGIAIPTAAAELIDLSPYDAAPGIA